VRTISHEICNLARYLRHVFSLRPPRPVVGGRFLMNYLPSPVIPLLFFPPPPPSPGVLPVFVSYLPLFPPPPSPIRTSWRTPPERTRVMNTLPLQRLSRPSSYLRYTFARYTVIPNSWMIFIEREFK